MLGLVMAAALAAPAAPQVMVVGVAHLVSRKDLHNSTFTDSPLSPKRQLQIADVVKRLARFHPTKVLVEVQANDATIGGHYQSYLTGNFMLPANEVYQFGFRLAKMAENPTIYPIDTWGPSLVDDKTPSGKRIDDYLEANLSKVQDPTTNDFLQREDEIERTGTYLDLLRYLNTEAAIEANASWYSVAAGIGKMNDNAGAEYVAQWYTRNVYIFANILNAVGPSDRAVVIMGQGHAYLLRDLVRLDPQLVFVDPLDYLGR